MGRSAYIFSPILPRCPNRVPGSNGSGHRSLTAGAPTPRYFNHRLPRHHLTELASSPALFSPNAARRRVRRARGSCIRHCASSGGAPPADRVSFYRFLVQNFLPAEDQLRAAAEAYLAEPTPERATQLAQAAEPTRQELLRRMNMVPGGTAALVAMRKDLLAHLRSEPDLKPLDSDLRHLLGSWFNRGFLELQRIDWQTPAAVLEKLIA